MVIECLFRVQGGLGLILGLFSALAVIVYVRLIFFVRREVSLTGGSFFLI